MRQALTQRGEVKKTIGGEDIIFCIQLQNIAAFADAIGVTRLEDVHQRILDHDVRVAPAALNNLVVAGDGVKALENAQLNEFQDVFQALLESLTLQFPEDNKKAPPTKKNKVAA